MPHQLDQPCLLRVQRQAILGESSPQVGQDASGVVSVVEGDGDVVGVPDEDRPAAKPWSHLSLEPDVHHLVQVDVRKDR
jgi:hypothetical protein